MDGRLEVHACVHTLTYAHVRTHYLILALPHTEYEPTHSRKVHMLTCTSTQLNIRGHTQTNNKNTQE